MRYFVKIFVFLGIIFTVSACAGPKQAVIVKCDYEKDAIQLNITADAQLNWDRTLLLCVYQLKDLKEFSRSSGYEDGVRELLHHQCTRFDHETVVASESLDIKPGQGVQLTLDRAEGAKFVAVIAGYYKLLKSRITESIEIPVVEKRKSFFSFKKIQKCDRLNIDLVLGKEQIQTFEKR